MTLCWECQKPVKPRSAVWLVPGWTGPEDPQAPVPFHPECVPESQA